MTKKQFPKPKKKIIDQAEIADFLKTIGFQLRSSEPQIFQQWRHLTAFGMFEGKPAVFKLASTQATGYYTQREYYWNEVVNDLPSEDRGHIRVPQNFSSGKYGKLFYFIDELFQGKALAEPMQPLGSLSGHIAMYIPKIARANRDIELFQIPETSEFVQFKKKTAATGLTAGEKLVQAATEWASQVPRDLSPFLRILEDVKGSIRTCPAHADFVIRHMFDVNGVIGVIDAEHAGPRGALHYDVAQFYIRLRSDHQALELAKKYLHDFYALLPAAEQDIFWEELRPPLIQRYIGDLWGSAKNPDKLDELAGIGQEILQSKIF